MKKQLKKNPQRETVVDALFWAGCACVCIGTAMLCIPVGLIVTGGVLVLNSYLLAGGDKA